MSKVRQEVNDTPITDEIRLSFSYRDTQKEALQKIAVSKNYKLAGYIKVILNNKVKELTGEA